MGRFNARAYAVLLYVGAVCGILGATRFASAQGLPSERVCAALLALFLPALIGSRLLFVASHWNIYRRRPARIWRRSEGGAALYGGLALSVLVSLPLVSALSLDFWAFWDAAAVAILIGMIFTRAGCLLTGCCAGRPSNGFIAFDLPGSRGVWRRRLPAQAFEAALAALLLAASLHPASRRVFHGFVFLSSLAAYAVGRWRLEPTREKIDRIGPWSLNRIISASFVLLSAAALLFRTLQRTVPHPAP